MTRIWRIHYSGSERAWRDVTQWLDGETFLNCDLPDGRKVFIPKANVTEIEERPA